MKQNKIHTESNILDNLKNQNGFNVPSNYFDSLHNSIMESTKKEETKVLHFTPHRILAYAASVMILIGVSIFVFNSNSQIDNEIALNNTTSEEFFDELIETDFDLETSIEFDEILAEF